MNTALDPHDQQTLPPFAWRRITERPAYRGLSLGIGKRGPDPFRVIFKDCCVGHATAMPPEIGAGIPRDDMHVDMEYGLPGGRTVELGHDDAIRLERCPHGARYDLG